jgi:hypothetical protein
MILTVAAAALLIVTLADRKLASANQALAESRQRKAVPRPLNGGRVRAGGAPVKGLAGLGAGLSPSGHRAMTGMRSAAEGHASNLSQLSSIL